MTGCDIISFDLDGALIDSSAEVVAAANAALTEHDIPARPADEVRRLIGHGGRTLMIALLARAFLDRPALAEWVRTDAVIASYSAQHERRIGSASRAHPGARLALVELRRLGIRTACLSNNERNLSERLLRFHGLDAHVDLLIGGDAWPVPPSYAELLRHVAQVLQGDPRRMAHVGASAIEVQAARAAGIEAWALDHGGGAAIDEALPHRRFHNLAEVVEQARQRSGLLVPGVRDAARGRAPMHLNRTVVTARNLSWP